MIEDHRSIPVLQVGAPGPSHLGTWDTTISRFDAIILSESERSEDESKDLRLFLKSPQSHVIR